MLLLRSQLSCWEKPKPHAGAPYPAESGFQVILTHVLRMERLADDPRLKLFMPSLLRLQSPLCHAQIPDPQNHWA